jgi:hypothetical protein
MKKLLAAGLMLMLGACAAHAVKCEGSLQPINQPHANSEAAEPSMRQVPGRVR